jgi:zinc/manganese transport system ATP-binding protein
MGRLNPSAGQIDLPPALRERLAWLPQQAQIERSVPMRVADVVALGLWRELGPFGGLRADQQQRVQAALDAVGLGAQAERPVAALSAGQFQRMLFARVLVQDARLVLLDEPFNAVDEDTAADLMAIVRRWRDEGRTVIAVLHDLALERAAFDQTLWLNRRCLAWGLTAEVLQVRPAMPEPALADLAGDLPDGRPGVLPPGWRARPADLPVGLAT